MKRTVFTAGVLSLAGFVLLAHVASAHVVVSPKEVGIGKFQTFTVGVPVEKEVATTGLRLVVPEGLNYVTPNVKPGWRVEVKKEPVMKDGKQVMSEDGDEKVERVSEISWAGGQIPAGQRDEFLFSAQTPSAAGALAWKAYQSYADGSVVAWDAAPQDIAEQKKAMDEAMKKDPNMKMDNTHDLHPYSETKIIDDLSGDAVMASESTDSAATARNSRIALVVSVISLVLAAIAASRKV